ncbi:MAG: hypothetical protein U0570_00835 [Phycisphaerales bacterium]
MNKMISSAALAAAIAAGSNAAIVQIDIYGEVEYNLIRDGALNKFDVTSGAPVHISFRVDSDVFQNDPDFPTRGYAIDKSSFSATYGSVTLGLQDPYPYAPGPFFVIRNNDPQVDGFFLSNGTAWGVPVSTSEPGIFENFGVAFETSYDVNSLSSLDILGAVGTWNYDGLSTMYFSTVDGGFDAMGLLYDHMTIAVVPAPASLLALSPLALAMTRRRR